VSATAVDGFMRGVERLNPLSNPTLMALRGRQVSRRNNGAVDNPASARWTSHETGQIIVLTGRGVERRSGVPQCCSMETVVIDKFGGSINGNDGWQLRL
jgi:hypothetical protein